MDSPSSIYIVVMERATLKKPPYVSGAYTNKAQAIEAGKFEQAMRGDKYLYRVIKSEVQPVFTPGDDEGVENIQRGGMPCYV